MSSFKLSFSQKETRRISRGNGSVDGRGRVKLICRRFGALPRVIQHQPVGHRFRYKTLVYDSGCYLLTPRSNANLRSGGSNHSNKYSFCPWSRDLCGPLCCGCMWSCISPWRRWILWEIERHLFTILDTASANELSWIQISTGACMNNPGPSTDHIHPEIV